MGFAIAACKRACHAALGPSCRHGHGHVNANPPHCMAQQPQHLQAGTAPTAHSAEQLAWRQHEGACAVLLDEDHFLVRPHAVPGARVDGGNGGKHVGQQERHIEATQARRSPSVHGLRPTKQSMPPVSALQPAAHLKGYNCPNTVLAIIRKQPADTTMRSAEHSSLEGVQLPEHGGAGDQQVGARGHAPLVGRLGVRQDPAIHNHIQIMNIDK